MANENDELEPVERESDRDDVYVIEDTGETLQDFDAGADEAQVGAADQAMVDQLRTENRSLKDQFLRSRADFENFRKRAEREKSDFFKYALANTLRELLPVLDNFERALAADTGSVDDFRKGVEMIYRQLLEALQKAGMQEIASENALFDPTLHEAVMREERHDVPSHTVLQVLQKGYTLQDRLLRPAMVKVAVGGPEPAQDAPSGDGLGG